MLAHEVAFVVVDQKRGFLVAETFVAVETDGEAILAVVVGGAFDVGACRLDEFACARQLTSVSSASTRVPEEPARRASSTSLGPSNSMTSVGFRGSSSVDTQSVSLTWRSKYSRLIRFGSTYVPRRHERNADCHRRSTTTSRSLAVVTRSPVCSESVASVLLIPTTPTINGNNG